MGRGGTETGLDGLVAREDPYPVLPEGHPLRALLARFDEAGALVGGWTCDGGAAALSHFLAANRIEHEPVVGLYHWPEERLADKWRLLEGGDPDDDDLKDYWDDEHHHWIEVPGEHGIGDGYIIDPNGEIRGEPRIQRWGDAHNYEPRDDYEQLSWSPWFQPADEEDEEDEGSAVPYTIERAYSDERPAWEALLGS